VLLGPGTVETPRKTEDVEVALTRVEDRLRMELASIIRIKRMPVLRLSYIPLPCLQQGLRQPEQEGGADETNR
jgi:hypothetical protein